MNIIDIIIKKRNKEELNYEEIEYFVNGYTNKTIKDYQASSLLMAIYLNGMNARETTDLTLLMAKSGEVLDLSNIKGIKVDKHSTGGVGDKVTLILGPLLASLGAKVAKMSGRGLGHTGGTVDKFESIPGYRVELSKEEFISQVNQIGISIVGQSSEVAPADKALYALRDVTGTIESIPLIASSIMSKKIASGANVIVLDVKIGSGAFMKDIESAKKLSSLMVSIGVLTGKKITALITDMDEPLGNKIGNALEVYEAIETLEGRGPQDLVDVVVTIASYLLVDSEIFDTLEEARVKSLENLSNNKAFEKFVELVKYQGGDTSYILDKNKLLTAKIYTIYSDKKGYIKEINALKIGHAAMLLGAGRVRKEDSIDHSVGIDCKKKINDYVTEKDILFEVYYQNDSSLQEVIDILNDSLIFSDRKTKRNIILDIIR